MLIYRSRAKSSRHVPYATFVLMTSSWSNRNADSSITCRRMMKENGSPDSGVKMHLLCAASTAETRSQSSLDLDINFPRHRALQLLHFERRLQEFAIIPKILNIQYITLLPALLLRKAMKFNIARVGLARQTRKLREAAKLPVCH